MIRRPSSPDFTSPIDIPNSLISDIEYQLKSPEFGLGIEADVESLLELLKSHSLSHPDSEASFTQEIPTIVISEPPENHFVKFRNDSKMFPDPECMPLETDSTSSVADRVMLNLFSMSSSFKKAVETLTPGLVTDIETRLMTGLNYIIPKKSVDMDPELVVPVEEIPPIFKALAALVMMAICMVLYPIGRLGKLGMQLPFIKALIKN